jgi:spore coat protein U-like protein
LRVAALWAWILILFVQMSAPPALADTGACSATASNIAFGSLTLTSLTGATTTGTVNTTCPGGHEHGTITNWSYCNSIGAGANSVSASNRTMTSGSNSISYNLYTDSGYTNAYTYLGNTVYTYTYNNSTGSTAPSTVYAMILSPVAGIPPGTYTDTYTSASQALVNPDGNPVTYSVAETCTGTTGSNWYNTLAFTVSVTLQASCTMSVTTMNFGSASAPITSNVTTTATATATCTSTTPYSIGLDNGQNASGSQRRMKSSSGSYINYGLYTDSARTQAWSTASSSTACTNGANTCVLKTGTGSSQSITIYGQVPPQTSPTVGSYSDAVVVTLTY